MTTAEVGRVRRCGNCGERHHRPALMVSVECARCRFRFWTEAEADCLPPLSMTVSEIWPEPPEIPLVPICRRCLGLSGKGKGG